MSSKSTLQHRPIQSVPAASVANRQQGNFKQPITSHSAHRLAVRTPSGISSTSTISQERKGSSASLVENFVTNGNNSLSVEKSNYLLPMRRSPSLLTASNGSLRSEQPNETVDDKFLHIRRFSERSKSIDNDTLRRLQATMAWSERRLSFRSRLSSTDSLHCTQKQDGAVDGDVPTIRLEIVTDREALLLKFWSWGHIVTCLMKMFLRNKHWMKRSQLFEEQLGQIRVKASSVNSEQKEDIAIFDPADYKADGQRKMTTEFKRILLKPPAERTDSEIRYAILALMSIPMIADFPLRMQNKLARNATFECFEGGRLILKEGHAPNAFYFILFGTVIIAVMDSGRGEMKTKCYLKRGDSFGELAIISRTFRQSSVLTKDYVEFLVIDSETYRMIFMQGGTRCVNDPDHSEFLQSIPFLRGWPLDILDNQGPENVIFCYFKRGTVIVKDSNYSDWIYIIKSGSVRVLKKLIHRKPTISALTGKAIKKEKNEKRQFFDFITPLQHREKPKSAPTRVRIVTPDDSYTTDEEHELESPSLGELFRKLDSITEESESLSTRSNRSSETNSSNAALTSRSTKADVPIPEERRTFVDDLDKRYRELHVETEADRNPAFVFIKTLTKKDVFGLPSVVFDNQPGMCLVSNGAECIMINKALYTRHCPERLFSRLRLELSPYPEDDKMQKDYMTRINWNSYKQYLINQRTCQVSC